MRAKWILKLEEHDLGSVPVFLRVIVDSNVLHKEKTGAAIWQPLSLSKKSSESWAFSL